MSRSFVAVSTASLLCLLTALASPVAAGSGGGVKGDPQPELKPFQISKTPSQSRAASRSSLTVTSS